MLSRAHLRDRILSTVSVPWPTVLRVVTCAVTLHAVVVVFVTVVNVVELCPYGKLFIQTQRE